MAKLISMIVVIILLIFLLWIFYDKKNKYTPSELVLNTDYVTREKPIQGHAAYINGVEYIDTAQFFDGCGRDLTHSNILLKQLYGDLINSNVVLHSNDDKLLYGNRWTSFNVCKGLNQYNIDKYGFNEVRWRL